MEPFVIKEQEQGPILFLLAKWMERFPYLTAGFTSRVGGVSESPFTSLNVGLHVNDNVECVVNNRQLVAEALQLPFDAFTFGEQVHGNQVGVVTKSEKGMGRTSRESAIQAKDAFVTSESGICLSALYADCVPLYFFDPVQRAIGLAHAGWKGSVLNISMATISTMTHTFGSKPEQLWAAIGPSIGGCCYEVDQAVVDRVEEALDEIGSVPSVLEQVIQKKENGKSHVDLKQLNRQMMLKAGILSSNIEVTELCTSCTSQWFFSHRKEGGSTGRMMAWMAMNK